MIDVKVSKPWQTSQVEEAAISILIHEAGKEFPDLVECPIMNAKYGEFCFI